MVGFKVSASSPAMMWACGDCQCCGPCGDRQCEGAAPLVCKCFSGEIGPHVAVDSTYSWEEEVQDILTSACQAASKVDFFINFFSRRTF